MMDAATWRRIAEVLDEALTLPPADRAALLDRTCSGDAVLRREVEDLLARVGTADGFLESPPVRLAAALVAERREEEDATQTGRRVGSYRIVREIGRGGMSRVFQAERADGQFEQRVALKLLRPGLDSPVDVERFRTERQILASLTHPGIAALLDGGVTADGQPYLVLEYIEGKPIDQYCSANSLPVPGRLDLFLGIADATQYAHRRLVVHRDLKPSNILVTEDRVVKLLDFGLARMLEQGTGVGGAATQTGHRWMTPQYAAPEQINGLPVTTLTDVYQLGAVLCHLLAGRPPFAWENLHALEEAVLHEDPDPPSRIAAGRATAAELQGDLDAIVLKALRKAPEDRYESVQSMADDIRRHLSGHPVLARRQTVAYRTRRFVRRHRAGIAALATILVLLGTYAVTVTVQRERIRKALREATLGTQKAERVTDFMVGLFEASEAGKALTDSVTARELLGRGLMQARELSSQPEIQSQLLDVIGRLYTELADYDRARPVLEEALAIRRRLVGERHPDYVTTLENLAQVAGLRQEVDESVRLRSEVLSLRRELSGREDPKSLNALYSLGFALHRAGQDSAAWSLLDEWQDLLAKQPRSISERRASQLSDAAVLLELRGETERAEPLHREALAIRRELYGDSHHLVGESLVSLGTFLDNTRRAEAAEPLLHEAVTMFRGVYPDGHPRTADALRSWGISLLHLKRFREAEAPLREAMALRQRFAGDTSIDFAMSSLDVSMALAPGGSYAEAASLAREGSRILEGLLGPKSSMVSFAGLVLGDALRGLGDYPKAESLLTAGYKRFEVPKPVTRPWRAFALQSLVRLAEAEGRAEDAARYRALMNQPVGPGVSRPPH